MNWDDILQSHWGCLQKHSPLFRASKNEEPFSHKIISLWRCLFLRYIPKRYYKHIFSAWLQLQRQRTKNPFDIFMFISFAKEAAGVVGITKLSTESSSLFLDGLPKLFWQVFSPVRLHMPANYLQVKRQIDAVEILHRRCCYKARKT